MKMVNTDKYVFHLSPLDHRKTLRAVRKGKITASTIFAVENGNQATVRPNISTKAG